MSSFLLRRSRKHFVSSIMTILLCTMVPNMAAARSRWQSSTIKITWSNSRGNIFVYKLSHAQTDRVKVQLVSGGRTIDTDTKPWAGGIDGLLALAARASREGSTYARGQATRGKSWRRLTVNYNQGVARRSFLFEGDSDELFAFFYGTTDLKALLSLVSAGAPKAYRLINEGDAVMPEPEKPEQD